MFKQSVLIFIFFVLYVYFLKKGLVYRVVVFVDVDYEDDLFEDNGGGQVFVEGCGGGG